MRPAPPWQQPARAWSLDGRVLPVACPPVLDLLPLLAAPTVYLVLGTLTRPADQAWLYQRILTVRSAVDDALLEAVADRLVWTWCGVERWFAARLWEEAQRSWVAMEGRLTARGVDISALPAARATRLVWSTLIDWHAQDKDKGQGWKRRIEQPPLPDLPAGPAAGRRRPSAAELAADSASFQAAFAAMSGRGG